MSKNAYIKNERIDSARARKLRMIWHGRRVLHPRWRYLDSLDREPWMRLARYFRRQLNRKKDSVL